MNVEQLSQVCAQHDGHRNLDDTLLEQVRRGEGWSCWLSDCAYAQARRGASWGQVEVLVHPGFRGQGLGSQLLERAQQWLREQGVQEIDCWAYGDREAAVNWLNNRGYQSQRVLYRLERAAQRVDLPELEPGWYIAPFDGEIEAWLSLHRRLQPDPRRAWQPSQLEQQLQLGQDGFWMLWQQQQLRGYAWIRRQEVFMLGVDPSLVGQGWGYRLLQWALSKELGSGQIFAYCDDTRLPALRLYARLGFEQKGRDRCLRRRW